MSLVKDLQDFMELPELAWFVIDERIFQHWLKAAYGEELYLES